MRLDEIQSREARCFLPVVRRMPIALVEGRGSRVRDHAGRELVDLTAGWGVTSIGHCHPALAEAIAHQASRLMQTTNLVYTLPQLALCERLARLTPAELTRSFLLGSGTEAVDAAIKLAHRTTGRRKFVSTAESFHGRTIGALGVGGQMKHRAPYIGILAEPAVVPFGDLRAAERAVDRHTAAVIVEPVQGEGGVNVPPDGYLRALRALCDEVGALLILDEIQTGVGRTGPMFALEHERVVPDVLTLAKGLGGGFPVSAFMTTDAIAETVSPGDQGGTYAGNPLGAAAADTVLRIVEDEQLPQRAARLGERILERLRAFAAERPDRVESVRGRGLLIGLVLHDPEHAARVQRQGLQRGVLLNLTTERVIRLFPALNIPEDDLWPALDCLLELVAS